MEQDEKLVLVVEDDPTSNRLFVSICEMHGWKAISVMTIKDGIQALEKKPLCIILDLILPDGDGEDIIREAKIQGHQAVFIVQSGTDDHCRLELLKELSPHAVLCKPVDCDQLVNLLDDCCQAQLSSVS